MPQLTFDKSRDMATLVIKLHLNSVEDWTEVELRALTGDGTVLGAAGLVLKGFEEVELLPQLLATAARGWLYGGPDEAVTRPAQETRAQRSDLRRYRP